MGGKKGLAGVKDFFVQSYYENPGVAHELMRRGTAEAEKRVPKGKRPTGEGGVAERPEEREEREAKEDAAKAKVEARQRIKPMPDPEAGKAEQRKSVSRRRQRRGGRASTVLSGPRETLG